MSDAISRVRRIGRRALVALAALAAAACFRWEPVPPAAAPARLGYVQAHRADGSAVRLARARLSVDSLVGRRPGVLGTTRVAVPRDSLLALRRRQLDGRRSVLAAMAAVALSAVAFSVAAPFTPH